jgi:hypothetical protein
MRILASFLLINALAFAQNLTEFGAIAAGSTVEGAGGKPVGNSISTIFGKVDHQTAKAAGKETGNENQLQAAILKADPSGVPLPPSSAGKGNAHASLPVAQYVVPEEVARIGSWAEVVPVLPPPPVMSPEDLRSVSTGMTRADVLRLGAPSSKITTFEDGHVVELYSYHQNGQRFGGLKLTDGVVSSVQ